MAFATPIDADAPRGLRGDVSRVRQILLNLLGNAIKFTEHGRVSLRVSALAPQGVRFEITDTGPGLNEEQQARLFRRFEQAEGARTAARYGGSGLGLAICQELAAAMGGTIAVDSTPGEGTRFIVDLPLPAALRRPRTTAPTRRGAVARRTAVAAAGRGRSDRGRGDRRPAARAGPSRHARARMAWRRWPKRRRAPFDAALLDLDLPGMDGLALARQLRAQGFARPLIAVTARADADAEPQAMAAGFDGFLRKPVTGAMLAGLLEGVPRRRVLVGARRDTRRVHGRLRHVARAWRCQRRCSCGRERRVSAR